MFFRRCFRYLTVEPDRVISALATASALVTLVLGGLTSFLADVLSDTNKHHWVPFSFIVLFRVFAVVFILGLFFLQVETSLVLSFWVIVITVSVLYYSAVIHSSLTFVGELLCLFCCVCCLVCRSIVFLVFSRVLCVQRYWRSQQIC